MSDGSFPNSFGFGQYAVPAPLSATSDPAVAEVQRMLNMLGYGPLDVDGLHGPLTSEAVKQFQNARGLPTSGQLDPVTVNALQGAVVNTSLGPPQAVTVKPSTPPTQLTTTPAPRAAPDIKTTLMYVAGIALVAGAAWYFFKGMGSEKPRRRRLAGVEDKEKCSRSPSEREFANAEAVEPPEEED